MRSEISRSHGNYSFKNAPNTFVLRNLSAYPNLVTLDDINTGTDEAWECMETKGNEGNV